MYIYIYRLGVHPIFKIFKRWSKFGHCRNTGEPLLYVYIRIYGSIYLSIYRGLPVFDFSYTHLGEQATAHVHACC